MFGKLILLSILISATFINLVTCEDQDREWDRKNVEKPPRNTYRYNHPPTVLKEYAPIPVAVVYESLESSKEKSLKQDLEKSDELKVSPNNNNDTNTKARSDENTKLKSNDSPEKAIKPNDSARKVDKSEYLNDTTTDPIFSEGKKLKQQTYFSASEIQIPVAVIYDTDTDIIRDKKARNESSITRRNGQKQRKQQKGFILTKTTEDDITTKSENTDFKIDNSSISVNVQSKQSNAKSKQTNSSITLNTEKNNNRQFDQRNTENNDQTSELTEKKQVESTIVSSQNDRGVKMRREKDPVVPIIESENHVFSHNGEFKYSYEGGDGTKAFSRGELKTFEDDKTGEAVSGGFSYKDKEGNDFSLSYTADENGYRPVGAHLPTPPPIPPAIARALQYLATKTTPEPVTEALTNFS